MNIAEQAVVVYSKISSVNQSELVMWVEQFPNAKVLTNRKAVKALVDNVKRAGFTSIGLDVKGPEGYVSYRKMIYPKLHILQQPKIRQNK